LRRQHCRIIGKPAEQWDDAEEIMHYFQSDPIIDELQALQVQVANMRQRLQIEAGKFYGIGQSAVYRRTCALIDKVALGKASVLLLGETGVGKEVIARSLHLRSERAGGPFVALNCAAIPPDLIEAELFGVEKGAYTGAQQSRMGRFERANGGSLFLDEIVELTRVRKPRYCGSCRKRSWNGSAIRRPARSTCGSSPRPTKTWKTRSSKGVSGRTCSTA
jgi:transcriptional regulator with GAF, ATPase, and Fis domain